MADPLRLTLPDQIFINAMSVLCCPPVVTPEHAELALYHVRAVLPQITRGHLFVEPVAQQAEIMLGCKDISDLKTRRAVYSGARFHAANKLSDLYFWRLGAAAEKQQTGATT